MNKQRPNEPPMPDPLAYFLTWTTYGTWLPGDERGWVRRGKGFQLPDPIIQEKAAEKMTEPSCLLDSDQRLIVEETIRRHCKLRRWELHAVSCRSNHVHVIVAAGVKPKAIRDQFKAWCTRKLKERQIATEGATSARSANKGHQRELTSPREKWWTEKGSIRHVMDQESLEAVILYVRDAQDRKDRDI